MTKTELKKKAKAIQALVAKLQDQVSSTDMSDTVAEMNEGVEETVDNCPDTEKGDEKRELWESYQEETVAASEHMDALTEALEGLENAMTDLLSKLEES